MKLAFLVLLAALLPVTAAEEKTEKAPVVLLHAPLILRKGATNDVRLRGHDLLAVTNAVVQPPGVLVQFLGAKEAKPPDGQDAIKVGAQRIDLSIFVPENLACETVQIVLASTNSLLSTNAIAIHHGSDLIEEIEPNNGFHAAQLISIGTAIRGNIDPKRDVDVYALDLAESEQVHLQMQARALGSAADTLLSILNAAGHLIASNDDASTEDRDAALTFTPKTSGRYFVVVQDANDRGGETHPYVLHVNSCRVARSMQF